MITLHKLRLFRVVYTEGSLNRAARALYMAQSAVSQHMQDLETALGCTLFIRTARGVQPTPAGDLLYDYSGRILALLEEAEKVIATADDAQVRALTVAATPGVSVYLLPGWLQTFRQHRPGVSVNLQTALTVEILRDVLSGRFDLGFIEAEPDEITAAALGRQMIRVVEYLVVVPDGHPWQGREFITVDELTTQPFITRQPASRARRWLERALGAAAERLNIVAEVDSPGAIKFAVLNGMGVGILPDYVIEREVARVELAPLRLRDRPLTRPLLLLWNREQGFNAVQRGFIESLAHFAPQLGLLV